MNRYAFLFAFAICILFFATVNAQSVPSYIKGLELGTSNANPAPGQSITVTARSYSIDINSAKVTWTVNSREIESGLGKTSITVTAPELGKVLNITARAVAENGDVVSNSITIGSGVIDMILESDGYVPPSYLGKIPATYQNTYKIIAIPHLANSAGTEYSAKDLVYEWKKNDQVIESSSGYGKQYLTIKGDVIPRAFTITVNIYPRDNSAQAQGSITITPVEPTMSLFINDPLYGPLYNISVPSYLRIGSQKETGVVAVPFGFNGVGNGSSAPSYNWTINGSLRSELSGNRTIVLRAPEGTSGTSNIQIEASNTKLILQRASAQFLAMFGSSDSNQ